jgi:N-acetylmuramoyl-L-alanine amidase
MDMKLRRAMAVAVTMMVALCALIPLTFLLGEPGDFALAQGASLRRGDRGNTVREIQQRLKDWGYYKGAVDGIFGAQTESAVKSFQRKHALVVDGIVGPATAAKIGVSLGGAASSGNKNQADLNLLARVVHGEARGEPYKGKVAVAAVVLNRVSSAGFPNTVSGVVYQPRAFSIVDDGQINLAPDSESLRAARDALNGYDPTSGCLFYYNPAKTTSQWMFNKPVYLRIGKHVFAK